MLIRLARQGEVGVGQKIEKQCHDAKLLVVRDNNGVVSVIDAHCFHMGAALIGGDIEDMGDGHTCVVCPAHRYRIDVSTGCIVDKDLCGNICASPDQKQRTYTVHQDADFIWVDLPDVALQSLPSDYYNQRSSLQQYPTSQQTTDASSNNNYGLLSSATSNPAAPLQPYAGIGAWPVVQAAAPVSPLGAAPPLQLSQESTMTTPAPSPAPPAPVAGRLSFPAVRTHEPAHIARRKAATAAILKKSYQPPVAVQPVVQAQQVLPQQQQQATAAGVVRQKTLFESWGVGATPTAPAVATGGPQEMDMN